MNERKEKMRKKEKTTHFLVKITRTHSLVAFHQCLHFSRHYIVFERSRSLFYFRYSCSPSDLTMNFGKFLIYLAKRLTEITRLSVEETKESIICLPLPLPARWVTSNQAHITSPSHPPRHKALVMHAPHAHLAAAAAAKNVQAREKSQAAKLWW